MQRLGEALTRSLVEKVATWTEKVLMSQLGRARYVEDELKRRRRGVATGLSESVARACLKFSLEFDPRLKISESLFSLIVES